MKKFLLSASVLVASVAAHAVTFSNILFIAAPPSNALIAGATGGQIGNTNAIGFNLPNAAVGDPFPLSHGTFTIQYDAFSGGAPIFANQVQVFLQAALLGSGTIIFNEDIFELDAQGNEIGTSIGSITHVFDSSSSLVWSDTIQLSRQVERLRAKKSFTMSALNLNQGPDLAALTSVNQNLQTVPEPGTMAALGLGAAALLRRRNKS